MLAPKDICDGTDEGRPRNHPVISAAGRSGIDPLGRETVLRDPDLDSGNNFQKYVLRYWHDAQPRNNSIGGKQVGKPQTSTLISAEEGNSLFMWSTVYNRAARNANGSLKTGTYDGATGVVIGDGTYHALRGHYQLLR